MSTTTVSTSGPAPEILLARYRATGDPQALGALFDATAPTLFRIGLSLLPDASAAEDAVQETFLAALEHLDKYDATRPVMPWLVGILQMMARRSRREGARRPDPVRLIAARAPTGDDAGHEDGPDLDDDSRRLREAIDTLEEPYRSAALLRWRYGLTPAEIADVRGEHPGTTRSILSRGLSRMRDFLKGAPAVFLLPTGPRGLATVKRIVLERAAGTAAAASVAATGGVLASGLATWGLAAAGLLAAVGGAWLVLRGGGSASEGAGTETPAVATATPGEPAFPPKGPGAAAPVVAPEVVTPAVDEATGSSPSLTPHPEAPPPLPTSPEVDGPDLRPAGEPEAPIPAPSIPPPPKMGAEPQPNQPGAPAGPALPGDDEELPSTLDEGIGKAVELGVRWLKAHQLPDGSWGVIVGNAAYDDKQDVGHAYTHPAGPTALALYTLLKCGVELDDPTVKKGFSFLRAKQRIPQGAYELSMSLLAVTATADQYKSTKESLAAGEKVRFPGGDWREWAQKLHDALLAKRSTAKMLGFRYFVDAGAPPPGGNEDLSSTQLAALALLAAERCGIKTDSKVWNDLLSYAMRQQETTGPEHPRAVLIAAKDGAKAKPGAPTTGSGSGPTPPAVLPTDHARGFAYILSDTLDPDEGRPTGGMTACGLATVQIARNVLFERSDRTYLSRDRAAVQQSIWDGLAWLDLHWSPFENPAKKKLNIYHVYYLYCMERACDLLGNVRLGKHLWYREMAGQLLPRQSPKGFWDTGSTHKPTAVLDTSFALLFLKRATTIYSGPNPSVTESDPAGPLDGRGK